MYSIKINNKEYGVRDSINIKEEYNETLDSAIIMLETKNEELDIEPYDSVLLLKDGVQFKRMLVDNFIYNQVSFTPEIKREYQINLFSETKALEKITLPDLSIKKSILRETPKTIYDYIFQYCATYVPKIKVVNDLGTWEYSPKYLIDNRVKEKFEKIECPEFTWNSPTLREVLNDLMMIDDCLCVVNNNIISYYDITEKGKEINLDKIDNMQKSMSSGDYNSDLTITMKNSIGSSLMRTTEYKSLRNDSSGEITIENAEFITQHPIYNIHKFLICGWVKEAYGDFHYLELDITDYIKEKENYDILSTKTIGPQQGKYKDTHQMYNLIYVQGDNKITGFGDKYSFTGFSTQAKIWWIMRAKLSEMGSTLFSFETTDDTTSMRDLMVKIEYDAITERKMFVGRYLPLKNEGMRSFDNQSSSYVDVQQQSLFEYSKIDRLSNDILIIYGCYKNLEELPILGDIIDDYILFSIEVNLYDNYIAFKGTLTRDYVLRNYFTGIQAKRRSWQLISGKDALTRYDVTKYFLEFSKNRKHEIIDNFIYPQNLFAGPLNTDTTSYKINHSLVYTIDENNQRFPPSESSEDFDYYGEGFELDLGVEIQGRSLCLNVGFYDNYSIDSYAYLDDSLYRNALYRYVNEHGEFNTLNLRFLTYIDPAEGQFEWATSGTASSKYADVTNMIPIARRKPLIKWIEDDYKVLDLTIPHYYKDNAEIIKQTIQFEFCADTRDIIVGKKFIEFQSLINDEKPELSIIFSHEKKYDLNDEIGYGIKRVAYSIEVNYLTSSVEIKIVDSNGKVPDETPKSWAIVDKDNNLILGVNDSVFTIYMNFMISRDDNVYSDVINQIRVGKSTRTIYPIKQYPTTQIKILNEIIDLDVLIKPKY